MARRIDREDAYRAAHLEASLPASPGTPRRVAVPAPRRAQRHPTSFAGSLGWAAGGTVLPGVGLLRTRWRWPGIVLVTVAALVLVGGGLVAWLAPGAVVSALVLPGVLTAAWVALVAFGLVWVASIVATHLLLRPASPALWQRGLGAALVGVLALAVAAPTFVGARAIYDTSQLINGVFGEQGAEPVDPAPYGNPADPWANKPRLNVLVLGGDSGADRTGTRTDTVILASIDTRTGNTVLFSLPRQTERIPFPPGSKLAARWPRGFTNGVLNDQNFALNAIYDKVPELSPEAIPPGVEDPGAEVLKLGVGTALGLPVDYYAMVNMQGFTEFVDALGGITVNINVPVPVGGKNPTTPGGSDGFPPDRWLVPGPNQHLNGTDALWFARGRYKTDDYHRMSRQRCVIQAVVKQANPSTVLSNYEALTRAGRNIVSTDVPNRQLPALLTLAMRVQKGTMTSVSFENDKDGFRTGNPDWKLVQARVQNAILPPSPPVPTAAPATPAETPTTPVPTTDAPSAPASPGPGSPASVVDECAYNPDQYPADGNG